MKLVTIFILVLSTQLLFAQSKPTEPKSWTEEWRPTISNLIGPVFTNKLLGKPLEIKKIDTLVLPKIPVIKEDAKSSEVYNKKPDKIVLTQEVEATYHFSFLSEMYEVTRLSNPSQEDFSRMMTVLSQGGSREGVYHALVLDSVYAQLETIDKPVKDPAAEFAIYFYKIYINKKISAENLKQMNMYSLKRLIAEKALDLLDAFGENREDMEKWYAILSSDFAIRFPKVWTNKLRQNPSKEFHKKWASKAPIQHIKSELLIKIHTAFNSLM